MLTLRMQLLNVTVHCFTYNIPIMNVYECNGKNILMRWKMECSIQRVVAEFTKTALLISNKLLEINSEAISFRRTVY